MDEDLQRADRVPFLQRAAQRNRTDPVQQGHRVERGRVNGVRRPHSRTLAALLLGLSDRVLESLGPTETPDDRRRVDALATIWLRSIYGTSEIAHPRRPKPDAARSPTRGTSHSRRSPQ
ncbi:hypothetical protein [Couchioplanes caeruleus]|uniref:HTH-type transcriptional regulator EthR C-terminal domain-containing protein n=1 Tax=Couchioplanes caeruleus subsp. caeruleus TaxID=56427 RepID=A0A1K0GP86_9ACTN|nr:hypothetical protein [Couchioplanes caeruleus]OJF14182.1 hypothetical protein BG844_11025 [Couchioplanes caeruleus subsp. caeruleus]